MLIIDTEGTGLMKPMSVALDQQPELIEFAAVKLDDTTLDELGAISVLIRPRVMPLGPETIKITGITTEMVADQLTFPRRVKEIADFFLGERTAVAHNISHDMTALWLELQRIGWATKFPWPMNQICTVELTMDLEAPRQKSDRLKLSELCVLLCGFEPQKKHRAMDDVHTLVNIVHALRVLDRRI